MNSAETKLQIANYIDSLDDELWRIASLLYENPELAFNEFKSVEVIKSF